MKKFFLALSFSCTAFPACFAQDLLAKVPADAIAVIKYSGQNFSKSVPVQKLDSYGFIRSDLFKMLQIDTLTSLQNTGIDLESDSYQYVAITDTSISFITMVHLKDTAKFSRFMKASLQKNSKTEQKNGFSFFNISDGLFVAMNDKMAVITSVSFDNHRNYYSDYYGPATDSVFTVVTEEPKADDFPPPPPPPPPPPAKKYPQQKKKPGAKTAPVAKAKPGAKKKPQPKVRPSKPPVEITGVDTSVVVSDYYLSAEDSIESLKRELWYQKKEIEDKKIQREIAVGIAIAAFGNGTASVANNITYTKIIDPAAHVSIWLNSTNLMTQYSRYFSRGIYGIMGYPDHFSADSLAGFSAASNIYFDKDKLRVEQKTFTADPQLADLGRSVMNSKQNPALANYVNPGNIGYFSMSINTEAMANYYYRLIKQYLSSNSYMREYKDIIDVYIDFLEIAIDEKALAELLPGNCMFVMHDVKSKTVTFTDYTYDSEYNRTETKGTKKELSPDFTFVIETKKEGFMQKLAKLPLKYAAKEHYTYLDRGSYYELVMDSSNVVGNIYFMVKDGKAIITTSREVIDLTLANKGFAIDAGTKKSILDNNYSFKLNSSKLLEKLSGEFTTATNKKVTDYLIDNIGDVKMESAVKDGLIQGTTTLNIKGNHANSLEFFFNMIDEINTIIEKDKQYKTNRLD